MNINFTLFDNLLSQHPVNKEEAAHIEKIAKVFSEFQSSAQGFHFPSTMTDSMLIATLKILDQASLQKSYDLFVRHIFLDGYYDKISSQEIKKFLLIQLAKKTPLNRYVDQNERTSLAYSALHGSEKTREILLKNFKHFDLLDHKIIEDIVSKSILLGNHNDFDTHQMMPLDICVMKQLILLIAEKDKEKAHLEVKKLQTYHPEDACHLRDLIV